MDLQQDSVIGVRSEAGSPSPRLLRHRFFILAIITVAGGVLRFVTLDRPPLWGDEALTYSRVIGSWDQMMQILRTDGFTPLHYILYWWMQQGLPVFGIKLAPHLTLTPAMMRLIPALCGTLMIPAMYFATRPIASVRAALVASAFAASSAYLAAYSHDAKMYMQTWLCVALNLGCLLWWLKCTRWAAALAWTGWVLSGSAAVMFHVAAAVAIAPQLVVLFSWPKWRWFRAPAALGGFVLIGLGPYCYYTQFNKWIDQSGGVLPAETLGDRRTLGDWDHSGLAWVEDHNRGISAGILVRETASAYLTGVEWPRPDSRGKVTTTPLRWAIVICISVTAGLIALGALPWRGRGQYAPPPMDGWRVFLWLAALLVLPVYGLYYCRSIDRFESPWSLIAHTGPLWITPLPWVLLAGAWYFSATSNRDRLAVFLRFGGAVLLLLLLCNALYAFWNFEYARHWQKLREFHRSLDMDLETHPEFDWRSIWMPRYIGVVWPALAIASSILLSRLPRWWIRWPAIGIVLGFNLVNAILRMALWTQPPHAQVFTDLREARDSNRSTRVVLTSLDPERRGVVLWLRASNYGLYGDAGRYYACIYLGLRPTPFEFRSGQMNAQYAPIAGEVIAQQRIPRVAATPPTRHLIIWERYSPDFTPLSELAAPDEIVTSLGDRWQQIGKPRIYPIRVWHTWSDAGWMRRREFLRAGQ